MSTEIKRVKTLEVWLGRIFAGLLLYSFFHLAFLEIHRTNIISDELGAAIAEEVIVAVRHEVTRNGCIDLKEDTK
jgi:hypothetical protein